MLENQLNIDLDLFQRISSGDDDAFRKLFTKYYDHVYSIAIRYLKAHELAEDMVQQVFLQVWEKRENLPTINHPGDYLFIIARNQLISLLRKNASHEKYIQYLKQRFNTGVETSELELVEKQNNRLIQQAISKLPPQQQQVYRLSREEGLNYGEIAAAMNITLHTVKWHMREALEGLRRILFAHKNDLLYLSLLMLLQEYLRIY